MTSTQTSHDIVPFERLFAGLCERRRRGSAIAELQAPYFQAPTLGEATRNGPRQMEKIRQASGSTTRLITFKSEWMERQG